VIALNRERALAVEALLRDADYVFWNIYGEGRLRMVPTFDMGPGADLSMSNFIATPTADATALQMLFTLDDAAA
jgi:hypothetical protein